MRERYNKYPIWLDLAGKRCLVVGAGGVAERKVTALLETGALVTIVGPEATERLQILAGEDRLRWERRLFEAADAEGADLIIAATGDAKANAAVQRAANKAGALVNVVDQPELCDFFVPAVVERGRMQIGISTNGASPALAKHVRGRLEAEFGPEYADYLEVVAEFRDRVRARLSDAKMRELAYEKLFASDLLQKVKDGTEIDMDNLVSRYA